MSRADFEKLPEIKAILDDGLIVFKKNDYTLASALLFLNSNVGLMCNLGFVKGAWYAWQEQQKRIDNLLNAVKGSVLVESCKCKPEKVC